MKKRIYTWKLFVRLGKKYSPMVLDLSPSVHQLFDLVQLLLIALVFYVSLVSELGLLSNEEDKTVLKFLPVMKKGRGEVKATECIWGETWWQGKLFFFFSFKIRMRCSKLFFEILYCIEALISKLKFTN